MPQRIRYDTPDFVSAMSVEVAIKDGKVSNKTTLTRGWRDLARLILTTSHRIVK